MKTKVKIALAMGENGKWNACGWPVDDDTGEEDLLGFAIDGLDMANYRLYWIEAEAEPPEVNTVKGEAVEIKE